MRVLVTGGAGYIGSHAMRELARCGHMPVAFDNLSTGFVSLTKGFELVEGDIGNRDAVLKAARGFDAVMHFAASAYVGESVIDPAKYFENNVRRALVLLDAVRASGIGLFVFSSTCAVYGEPAHVPITEDTPTNPVNPYGVTKRFFENALAAYDRAYGMKFAALRYFNAAGALESGEIGELHCPETHLIPLVLQAALTGTPVSIFGRDYPTSDGTCVRDYIHVDDLATAHVRALELLASSRNSFTVNLGTGNGYSVREVIDAARRITGRDIPLVFKPRREGDPPELIADASRAKTLLGWRAQRNLDQMVASAWAWMCKQHSTVEAHA